MGITFKGGGGSAGTPAGQVASYDAVGSLPDASGLPDGEKALVLNEVYEVETGAWVKQVGGFHRIAIAFNGLDNISGANFMRFALSEVNHVKQATGITVDITDSNNNKIIINKTGWYDIDCVAGVDANNAGDGTATLTLRINNVSQAEKSITKLYRTASSSDSTDKFIIKASRYLTAGDEIQFYQQGSLPYNISDRAIRVVEFEAPAP